MMKTTVIAFSPRQAGKAHLLQLARAYEASGLSCGLDEALRNPTIARLLEITVEAWSRPAPPPSEYRPPPAPLPAQSRIDPDHSQINQPRRDVKRASAGDKDE
jgi:hypothetical protein